MSQTELADAILRVLRRAAEPLMAREILRSIRTDLQRVEITKSEVNSVLYGELEPAGLVIRQPEHRWACPAPEKPRRLVAATATGDEGARDATHRAGKSVSHVAVTRTRAPGQNGAGPSSGGPGPCAIVTKWDDEQRAVIEAAPNASLLVEAGPGTGKTAVACGRIAHLVRHFDLSPSNILLISFTRTAVMELKQRIAGYLGVRASGVCVSTLDSEAWRLHQGFSDGEARLFGGYDANIEQVRTLLRGGRAELLHYLERFQHVVIDEAQDLMGIRTWLVLELLEHLNPDCGVTVFADPAQAIYGFTVEDVVGETGDSLLALLPASEIREFEQHRLTTLHRTGSAQLGKVFRDNRRFLQGPGRGRYAALRQTLARQAPGSVPDPATLRDRSDHLLLYRHRRDVARLSQDLCGRGIPHRLRLSRVPVCVQPWIGWLLGYVSGQALGRSEFDSAWEQRGMTAYFPSLDRNDCFDQLLRLARRPDKRIDLHQLRRVFARSRPPVEICTPECGLGGPIVGTIHASKGREASHVLLGLPSEDPLEHEDEEMRVLYVGATRARVSLRTFSAQRLTGRTIGEEGRLFWKQNNAKRLACIEFGLDGDVDVFSPVRSDFLSCSQAEAIQRWLRDSVGQVEELTAENSPDWGWSGYRLRLSGDATPRQWVGQFSDTIRRDLNKARSFFGGSTYSPRYINNLYLIAVRTVAAAPDSPIVSCLHESHASSGFWLAPVVRGYPLVKFGGAK
jgi:hypothetical protein